MLKEDFIHNCFCSLCCQTSLHIFFFFFLAGGGREGGRGVGILQGGGGGGGEGGRAYFLPFKYYLSSSDSFV